MGNSTDPDFLGADFFKAKNIMDKKNDQLTIHLASDKKSKISIFAELENKSLSEMGEFIIDLYLAEKNKQFQLMQKAFNNPENL